MKDGLRRDKAEENAHLPISQRKLMEMTASNW